MRGLDAAFPDEILIGLDDRAAEYHDVYRVNVRTTERELVAQNDSGAGAFLADHGFTVRALHHRARGRAHFQRTVDLTCCVTGVLTHPSLHTLQPAAFERDRVKWYWGSEAFVSQLPVGRWSTTTDAPPE